jgi:hypothetical protein
MPSRLTVQASIESAGNSLLLALGLPSEVAGDEPTILSSFVSNGVIARHCCENSSSKSRRQFSISWIRTGSCVPHFKEKIRPRANNMSRVNQRPVALYRVIHRSSVEVGHLHCPFPITQFLSFATTITTRADGEGPSRRLTKAKGLSQFASTSLLLVGTGRLDGSGTGSPGGVGRSRFVILSPLSVVPSPLQPARH